MTNRFKYPRTPHLPWSLGSISDDDCVLKDTRHFEGKLVVITEKLDGENTSLYQDYLHARSLNFKSHLSRDWIKRFHAGFAHLIPEGWRLCGENLYAMHSIAYQNLESYFYLFSIWNQQNECLSWDQTLEWAKLLDLKTPKELYKGYWDEKLIAKLSIDTNHCEGYVVRASNSFSYETFGQQVAKWVRPEHNATDQNWMHQATVPNRLSTR